MFIVKKFNVEGTIDNFNIKSFQGPSANYTDAVSTEQEAISDLNEVVKKWQRMGSEVVMSGKDRAFVIDESNRVEFMFDVTEV